MSDSSSELDTLLAKIARGGLVSIVGQISNKGFYFLFLILMARYLGPSEYGVFILGWIIISLSQTVAGLGVDRGVVRLIPENQVDGSERHVRGVIVTAIGISVLTGVIVAAALYLTSDFVAMTVFSEPKVGFVIRVLAAIVPFWAFLLVAAAIAQSFQNITVQQIVNNLRSGVLPLFLAAGAMLIEYQLTGVLRALVLSAMVAAAISLVLLKTTVPLKLIGAFTTDTSQLLRISLPLFLSGFVYSLLYRIDQLILGAFVTTAEVGIYNAASVLATQLSVFLLAIGTIFEPIASKLQNAGNTRQLEQLFKRVTTWAVIVTVPAIAVVWGFPDMFLSLFGTDFRSGQPLLLVLTLYPLVRIASGPTGELMQMTRYQNIILFDTIGMISINVILNVVLISILGTIGAAVATTISIAAFELLVLYQVHVRFDFNPFSVRYVLSLMLGAVLLAVIGTATVLGLELVEKVFLTIVALTAYSALIWQFAFEDFEKKALRNIIKHTPY